MEAFLLLGILSAAPNPAQTISATNAAGNVDPRVTNAPYSAQRRFTNAEKLADGTTRITESGGSEARDSQGRTYSAAERHWTFLDQGKSVLKSEMLYRIDDPVSNTETKWDSTAKEVKVVHFPKGTSGHACGLCTAFTSYPTGTTVEKLGVRTIEGVVAEGTRNSYAVGNEDNQKGKPLTVIHES